MKHLFNKFLNIFKKESKPFEGKNIKEEINKKK